MADNTFDVVMVGGGTKGLFCALYLQKFGGMQVAIIEERHELGGGLSSHEAPAPGFIGDPHASTLREFDYIPLQEDFPEIKERGLKFAHYPMTFGVIDLDHQTCWGIYHYTVDPDGTRAAQDLARFSSEKDADTFFKIFEATKPGTPYEEAMRALNYNIQPRPGEPHPMSKWFQDYVRRPDAVIDERFLSLPADQAVAELWEHPALHTMFLRRLKGAGVLTEIGGAANLIGIMTTSSMYQCYAVGGTHSIAHAAYRCFKEDGGQFFTHSKVDKIVIESGTAKGVLLADGTRIDARKLVVSGVDPYQLCFELIGKEYFGDRILKKIANLERNYGGTISWYTWALHELPKYKAADFNPEINRCQWIVLASYDDKPSKLESAYRRLGQNPPIKDNLVIFHHHSMFDRTRAPVGKETAGTEQHLAPAWALSEKEWIEFQQRHAEETIEEWSKYAPNISWDTVIGFDPITPYHIAKRLRNMAPAGNWAIIDVTPAQTWPNRPIPEFAQHRLPIKSLYATGSAWAYTGNAGLDSGYTCYKAIAEDLGLRTPWKEKGRPW